MSQNADQLNQEAIHSYGGGLLDEAIRLWREALLLAPDNWEIMVYLGSALKKSGEIEATADC